MIRACFVILLFMLPLKANAWDYISPLSPKECLYAHEMAHAGGWGPTHPGAIKTKKCGHLPMPPKPFPIKKGFPVHIHYVPAWSMIFHCGPQAQACTWPDWFHGGAVIYLPIQ